MFLFFIYFLGKTTADPENLFGWIIQYMMIKPRPV